MAMEVRPYCSDLEESVMKLNKKAWVLFKYNKDYEHQKMSCLFDEDGNLVAVGYLRHGIADHHDVMEIVMEIDEKTVERISEVRKTLYPSLINIFKTIRNPTRKTKLVAWEDFEGDKKFYLEQGFYPYQSYHKAKRSIDESSIEELKPPFGVEVRHHPMKSKEERIKYTEIENQFYQGVVYRSVNMLEWMMAGPELYTISAFEGEELVGSVMCWQTGAVERLFVIPRWRNKGLEELLISKAFEYHLKKGRYQVYTLANEEDEEKKNLLKNMGYDLSLKMHLLALDFA